MISISFICIATKKYLCIYYVYFRYTLIIFEIIYIEIIIYILERERENIIYILDVFSSKQSKSDLKIF